jgi:TPR repeat protein
MKPSHIAAFAIWAVLATPVAAQTLNAGLAAYNAGDYATALENWQPLAAQGDAAAQFNLALMYDDGRGVLQDYAEAVRWYRLAAEQGNAFAQGNLGLMYAKGQGVLRDYAQAVRWYRLAAEQGDAVAQSNLGFMYATGQGVLQDIVLAHMWFNIASVNGNEGATRNRARTVEQMTREQIADAQARARVCLSSGYRDCD